VIENNPVLHYLMILAFYMLGQFFLVICTAYLAVKSTMPNGVFSLKHYFVQRWPPLALRWFVSLCLFFLVWNNSRVMDLERFMPTFPAHMGAAGLLGWLSDSVLDKVLAVVFPGINKTLPAIPTPEDTPKL
jgi:hypothetical protein